MKENPKELIDTAVSAIQELKGSEITILDFQKIENTFCDYFLICNGNSNTHVNAISDSVTRTIRKAMKIKPIHVEKTNQTDWVLIDYGYTIIHIFQPLTRTFYDLESLWQEAEVTTIEETILNHN